MSGNTPIYEDKELQKELYEIYRQYHNSIKGFIGQLEVLQNKFPVEILNEIRAVFSHIAKIYVCDNSDVAYKNLNKAKGHIKRAQLDSFKYMCYAYSKYYKEFKDLYKNVDLSHINNGEFITELSKLYDDAVMKSGKAKKIEANSDDVISSYEAYEDAYIAYTALYIHINTNLQFIYKLQEKEKLQQKEFEQAINGLKNNNAELHNEISKLREDNLREKNKNKIITAISIILALISVILGIVALL